MMFHSSRFPDLIRMALHSVCDARHRSPYAREHHCLTAVRANRHEKQQPEIQQQHKKSTEYKWPLIIRSSAAIQAILEIAFSSSTPLRRLTITRTELPSVEEQSKKKSIARSATRDFNSDNFFSAASSSFFFLSLGPVAVQLPDRRIRLHPTDFALQWWLLQADILGHFAPFPN